MEAVEDNLELGREGLFSLPRLAPDDDKLTVEVSDRYTLAEINIEKLEALAEVYGISKDGIVNMAISDLFDSKVGAVREAEGE